MSIHNAAEQWIYAKLNNDATITTQVAGRVYSHLAPQSATYPLILFAPLTASDVQALGPARIMTHLRYKIVAINENGTFGTPLSTIADRIDALLQASSGTVSAGTVMTCVREQPFAMLETSDGRTFRHLGGIYELTAQ